MNFNLLIFFRLSSCPLCSIQRIAVAGESRPHQLRSDVMERLQQLEEQLNAIESTARNVEGEFKTTNQVKC